MDSYHKDKKYDSYKIPGQQQFNFNGAAIELPQSKSVKPTSPSEGMFYEIEYDSSPFPGVGKYVLKPQKIEEPKRDEKRELFGQMRDIARNYRSFYVQLNYSKFYDRRVQQDNAFIFYKQAMFMKDFSDDFTGNAPFSQYFPNYQMMGYEQLRTYFTWRTQVRKGNVADISLSYAFLYIYELLNNIAVRDPLDGLEQLMSFWKAFRVDNKSIDKYILRWLKDYHIYYELPHSFKEFIDANNLTEHYPKIVNTENNFDLYCTISKYDIRKSAFYTKENIELITDCFYFVIQVIRQKFLKNGIHFAASIFQPTKKMKEWRPFKDALFHPWMKQGDRQVVLSENEIYICSNNKWAFNTVITSDSSKQLMGYIIKQMEVALRKATNYKYKLSASIDMVNHEAVVKLNQAGLSLEAIINDAVTQFYREATKTVVVVDQEALSRIREEALLTQEKLIVSEEEKPFTPILPEQKPMDIIVTSIQDLPSNPSDNEPTPVSGPWESLKNTLTEIEIKALSVVLHNELELKTFADECGIMLEVLVDGINEKAMDLIGDSLIDDEFIIYDDYKEQVKEMIG